jgi:hypothetical protein
MGAWSYESFGNDDACDWAGELAGLTDLAAIGIALDEVLEREDGYLEAPEAARAIAAAETVARLQGNWGKRDDGSKAVDAWVEMVKLSPNETLVNKALRALDRVVEEPSELLDLWQEQDEAEGFLGAVRELKVRLET